MAKSIISEGKTTNEAIEKGLQILKVSKNMVDVKVLENEEKRSFFSILTPRVVKVELTLKENKDGKEKETEKNVENKKSISISEDEQQKAKKNIEKFLNKLLPELQDDIKYEVKTEKEHIFVNINNENLGFLIGYRGETLYSFQNLLTAIASKNVNGKVRVVLDIEGYKEKREKTLKELADRVAKTVINTKKPVTLEPMKPYERKVIHTELQNNPKVQTRSIGEEPKRRIVISLKNK